MRKEEKQLLIDDITVQLSKNANFYLTDISNLNAEKTSNLRRLCFSKSIKLVVVKNSLLRKAMEKSGKDMSELYVTLSGATSIMFSESGNAPAKLIKEFRKTSDRPILKGAFIEEAAYIGDNQLDFLISIKSKNELIGDLIALLQSPIKNVVGSLQSGGHKISGILQTLSEKPE
ncbi:MAG: 50S ribosomal protein L10 [Bacteroidetes bacterium]|nr:50S ribosomal protein L10 [Bacteroidales bacterium]MBS4056629.1 50S ribosomal protein L10 [Bacteroidales bacterium]MBU1009823.1 50S ribosomal protein L10 [Bacteroidota bacterium]